MGLIPKDKYFATLDQYSEVYCQALVEKVNKYRTYLETTGKISKWGRMLKNYYGISTDGQKSSNMAQPGGKQGELTLTKVNDFRNLVQHMLIMTTSQRPAGEAKATNSDTESLKAAMLGSSVCEYLLSQVGWEEQFVKTAEHAVVLDEGFIELDQDATSGEPIRPNPKTGQLMMSGELKSRALTPWRVARDHQVQNPRDCQWWITSYDTNKFDLAEKFPNQGDKIISATAKHIKELSLDRKEDDSDQVTVYCLQHAKSPSVKTGRITLFIPEVILLDGGLPYPEVSIYRMSQSDIIESAFGYSNASDILSLEDITDALYSIIASNELGFGGNVVVGPKNSGMVYQDLGKALKYLEMDPNHIDKVKTLQLLRTAPEIFEFLKTLGGKKEAIAGVNSVIRGEPEGALKGASGSALALVQAAALQFNSGLQRSYYNLLSKTMTGAIKIKERYVLEPETIRIAGKVKAKYLKERKYTGDELGAVSSVIFEMVDPVEKSMGGRVAMGQDLLNANMLKNPRQYLTLVKTGSLDALIQDDLADEMALVEENERLREGLPVKALIVENHEEHMKSCMSVVASPQAKEDPDLVERTLSHYFEHFDMWQNLSETNPALLLATGQKVLPVAPPPGMPMQGGDGAMAPAAPAAPAEGGAEQLDAPEGPGMNRAKEVQQPKMPVNPLTGDRAPAPPSPGM